MKSMYAIAIVVIGSLIAESSRGQCGYPPLVFPPATIDGYFGQSLSIDDHWAVVGARGNSEQGKGVGSAYVCHQATAGGPWTIVQALMPQDGWEYDRFATDVAISGDIIVAGAPHQDEVAPDAGAAYVYRRDPGGQTWSFEAKLLAADATENDLFGWAVATDGTWIMASARTHDGGVSRAGACYVFRRNAVTHVWEQFTKLVASDRGEGDEFGNQLAMDNGTLLVGAWGDTNQQGFEAGAGYVFEYDDGDDTWTETAKLVSSHAQENRYSGMCVDIEGDVAVLGSGFWTGTWPHEQKGFVFKRDPVSGIWSEKAPLFSGYINDNFVWTDRYVNVSGDIIWLSNYRNGILDPVVFRYQFNEAEDAWLAAGNIPLPPGHSSFNHFGRAIDSSPENLIVGAMRHLGVGAAIVFEQNGPDCNSNWSCDGFDIQGGTSGDADRNGIPDECETPLCPTDIAPAGSPDGVINVSDLLAVIGAWGTCGNPNDCPADIAPPDGNDVVNVADLLAVIGQWGPCR